MRRETEVTEENKDSVELSRNAKGDYSWTIKVYGELIAVISSKIEATNNKLKETYGGEKP